jgi:hypothetical protein
VLHSFQTILTWLTPLLPEQPRSVRQLSERAAKSGWTCSVKAVEYSSGGGAVDVDTDDELSSKKTPKKLQIDAGQSDDWTIEVTMGRSESDGVGDDLLQACIAHAGQFRDRELNGSTR